MTQGWNPQVGITPISRRLNVYIMQAPEEDTRNNEEIGTAHRSIEAQNNHFRKPCNYR